MTNLIFDLSNMFYRSMFIVGGYGTEQFTFDSQQEVDKLMRKVTTDISYIIRQLNPSRVLFAIDSRSWRKDISIDENDGYKANRKKSEHLNWDNIFNTMKEFGDILDTNGFVVTKVETAEADDIITLWRDELLFNKNEHVIMVSADEDIRQLAAFWPYTPGKMAFGTIYNPFSSGKTQKKLYVPKHFNEWLNKKESGDIFNRSIDVDKEEFFKLRDNENVLIEEINGEHIGLKKIFCGDDGDNVPAIHSWLNQKEKKVRITNSKFIKILDLIKVSDYLDLFEPDNVKIIEEQLIKFSEPKIPTKNIRPLTFKIKDRLARQSKLVILSRNEFPEEILDGFDNIKETEYKRPYINAQECNLTSILDGTRYINSSYKGNESSIFKDIDKINSKLF